MVYVPLAGAAMSGAKFDPMNLSAVIPASGIPLPPTGDAAIPYHLLQAWGITISFEGLVALADVSLSLAHGEILGLIGPNGAGKSTLVNCLTGFQRPTSGVVLLDGKETSSWPAEDFRRRGVARTFQGGRLFHGMTVYENVEATALGLGKSRRSAAGLVWGTLDSLGLASKAGQTTSSLTYTDERRVGIARALIAAPQFLLLDEPAAGMTPHECDDLMALISKIPSEHGCGVLLIEHNMRVVMSICNRIHVLASGRTLAEGSPGEIRRNETVIAAYLGVS
jgi:branched-chain amino acid transport system ATP-binding protein